MSSQEKVAMEVTDIAEVDEYTRRRLDFMATQIQCLWKGYAARKAFAIKHPTLYKGRERLIVPQPLVPSTHLKMPKWASGYSDEDLSFSEPEAKEARSVLQKRLTEHIRAKEAKAKENESAKELERKRSVELDATQISLESALKSSNPSPKGKLTVKERRKLHAERREAERRKLEEAEKQLVLERITAQERHEQQISKMNMDELQMYLMQQRVQKQGEFEVQRQFIQQKLQQLKQLEATPQKRLAAPSPTTADDSSISRLSFRDEHRPNTVSIERGLLMAAAKRAARTADHDSQFWANRVTLLKHQMEKTVFKIESAKRVGDLHEISSAMSQRVREQIDDQQLENQKHIEQKRKGISVIKKKRTKSAREQLTKRLEEKQEQHLRLKEEEKNNQYIVQQGKYDILQDNIHKRVDTQKGKLAAALKRVHARSQIEEAAHQRLEDRINATLNYEQEKQQEAISHIRESALVMHHLKKLKEEELEARRKLKTSRY